MATGTDASSPPFPASKSLEFPSADGTRLRALVWTRENARGNALIIHGYAEHCARYEELAEVLRDWGLNVVAVDLRGHGRSAGPRGHINRFEDYLDDAEAALAQLEKEVGQKPTLLVGHSNGSLISLRMLADPFRCPKQIVGSVLGSPFLGLKIKVNPVKKLAATISSRLVPAFSMPNEIKIEHLTHDPDKLRERELDTLCHDVATSRWFTEAVKTQEWVMEFAHRIQVPTLWLVAGMDQIADPSVSARVHQRIQHDSRYHEYPQMHHEVFNEVERAELFALVRAFCGDIFHV